MLSTSQVRWAYPIDDRLSGVDFPLFKEDSPVKRATKSPRLVRSLTHPASTSTLDECDLSILTDTYSYVVRACQIQTFKGFYENFNDVGLTPGSYATLAIIGANPGVRQGFVATLLGFREPNMVRLVKELVAADLIVARRSEHDKRAMGLELTPHGEHFMKDINARVLELDASFTQGLSAAERSMLMTLLQKVLKMNSAQDSPIQFHDA